MTSTAPAAPPRAPDPPPRPYRSRPLAFLANTWRGLTSMRTALVLLFLLAVAALPGALLPQRSLNPGNVAEYLERYPTLGPVLDRLGFFEVFASPWFAAIYLLLFVSLIGCLSPRSLEYLRSVRAAPVATPRNLARLPHHATGVRDEGCDDALARVRGRLRGWRVAVRDEPNGRRTVSAEKGYLREAGNLVFHLSLIGLLIAIAVGKLFGYEGQVIVLDRGGQFCNTGILGYDSFTAGAMVDGTRLSPFCVKVNSFDADYLPNGQPTDFTADIGFQAGADLTAGPDGPWRPYRLKVNEPLRMAGDRVYLLGHGYAPVFEVTFPDGQVRTAAVQWRPADPTTLLSEGATKFDQPGLATEEQRRNNQLAITGLFAPTSSGGRVITSVFPALLAPEVAVDVLRGDLGLDDGRGQSIFEVDRRQIESGELRRVARANIALGEQLRLDDGTVIRFTDVRQWVSIQVSHDPAQHWVLVFAVLLMVGLALSLTIRRRRFWARLSPVGPATGGGRTVVEIGGLARTDQAGYGEEFTRLRAQLLPADPARRGSD